MAKSPNEPQPTLHSGPCHAATMTAHASPTPLAATPCHTTGGIQRNTLGRPSTAAAHAAHVRASALQQANKPVELSRKAAVPSQNVRARAVGRHQCAVDVRSLNADFKLTQDLLAILANESAEAKTTQSPQSSVSRVSSRSSAPDSTKRKLHRAVGDTRRALFTWLQEQCHCANTCHSTTPTQSKPADRLTLGVCCEDERLLLHQSLHDIRPSFNRHNAVAYAGSPLPFTNRHLIADKPQPSLPVSEFSNHQLLQPQSLIPPDLLFSHPFYQHSTETLEVPPT
jgi:hypothetical protein